MAVREIQIGDTSFYAEVADQQGVSTASLGDVLSFDEVRKTVEAIAGELKSAWDAARPQEASVEFGLALSAKSGKLTGLLVEGSGEASLTITLTWKQPDESSAPV